MKNLSDYNNKYVRILLADGDSVTGACVYNTPEYTFDIFGIDEEALSIGNDFFFADDITDIEILRNEVCIPVRDWPEAKEEIISCFIEKQTYPYYSYKDSIIECLGSEDSLPQWYVVLGENKIIAGCGVVDDFFGKESRFKPSVCFNYADEEYRSRGVKGFMLDFVCGDMKSFGVDTLYLLSGLYDFYEEYGWQYYGVVKGVDGELLKVYYHRI